MTDKPAHTGVPTATEGVARPYSNVWRAGTIAASACRRGPLNKDRSGSSSRVMRTRVIRMVIALVVAFAVTMPVGVGAMPMPTADMNGKTLEQPCQNCPQPDQTGGTTPDKMPACQVFACVGSAVLLPAVAVAPGRVLF